MGNLYPLTVKSVYEGGVTVLVDELGPDGAQSNRFSVPKTHIPEHLHGLLTVGAKFEIVTDSPFNTHTWKWAVSFPKGDPLQQTIHPLDMWGDMTLICERIYEDFETPVAHFRIFHGDHEINDDYVCSLHDLPPVVRSWAKHCYLTEGYLVTVPEGMMGDPKQWNYQQPIDLTPETPEAERVSPVQDTLGALRHDIDKLQEEIEDRLLYLNRTYLIVTHDITIFATRDGQERGGIKEYDVFLDIGI